jgi:hypothetical protein
MLYLITILHLIVVLFVVLAPFSNSNYLLFMHAIIVPFIIMHWVLNNNTCSLTLAEKYIRETTYGCETKYEDCFMYKLIAPIYDFNKNHEGYAAFTYVFAISLWSVSVYNLNNKWENGEIRNFRDLTKI